MLSRLLKLCAVAAMIWLVNPPDTAGAADAVAAEPELIRIAGGRNGTAWHAFASALASLYESAVPGVKTKVIRRGNGYWNPIFVNSLRAEFALAHAAAANWAWRGDEIAYPKKKKYQNIRVVMGGMRPIWMTAMLREDYIRRTGYFTLDQALSAERGAPRIVMEPFPSTIPVAVDMMLAAMGVDRAKLRERGGDVLQVGSQQIPSMIRDGRVDLYIEATVADHPTVLEAALTGDVRFVDLPGTAMPALERAGLPPRPLPRWFKGQEGEVNAVDLGTVMLVNHEVPNETVYRMLLLLIDKRLVLAESHSAWRDYNPTPRGVRNTAGVPMHPGAVKFFRDRGWLSKSGAAAVRPLAPVPRSKPAR